MTQWNLNIHSTDEVDHIVVGGLKISRTMNDDHE